MSEFVYREPALIVQDVIQHELGLADGQVISAYQKFFIPTNGLFIPVSYVGPAKVICCMDEWADNDQSEFTEMQSLTMAHLLQIDVMSFGPEARARKEEVTMAINSLYAEAQMERYSMQMARHLGPFMDTSFLEATKFVTRYTATLMTTSVNRKIKPVGDYYTDFKRAVPPQLTVNA